MDNTGVVFLVGAGPGDPALITVRGAKIIAQCNVIIYDRLANPQLLNYASADCERIYVGKKADHHSMSQDDINALLVEKAKAGKQVCRLKGGDPFVFGRGGEEAEYCLEYGVRFEIVPGVTSAIAAPAYAGIPVTHRDLASSFAIITGHERDDDCVRAVNESGQSEGRRNWSRIAHAADTLLFLMGVEHAGLIQSKLLEYGRHPSTPVALVRWGTWNKQQVLTSNLADLCHDIEVSGFKAPAIIIIGEVVNLREKIKWFENRPLFGKRILITRPMKQSQSLASTFSEYGAEAVTCPTISIQQLDCEPLEQLLISSTQIDLLMFTSSNAVGEFVRILEKLNIDTRRFGSTRVCCVGSQTASSVFELLRIIPDYVPQKASIEGMIQEWNIDCAGEAIAILPCSLRSDDRLERFLSDKGFTVHRGNVYDSVDADKNRTMIDEIVDSQVDYITFSSSSAVTAFSTLCSIPRDLYIDRSCAVCVGKETAQTAIDFGFTNVIVAKDPKDSSMLEAILEQERSLRVE